MTAVIADSYTTTDTKVKTKELTRNLGNGASLWKTTNAEYTYGLRTSVLGWNVTDNVLDSGIGTEHLVITSFDRDAPPPTVYSYENNVANVSMIPPKTAPCGDAGIPSNGSLDYHMAYDNAHVIGASSLGYQDFPFFKGLLDTGVIDNPLSYAGVPALRFYAIAVHPNFQHQGLGLRVMNEISYEARRSNAGILWAYARESALTFYTGTLGFTPVGEWFKDRLTNQWSIKIAAKI